MDLVDPARCGADQISRVHRADSTLTVVRQRVRPVLDEDWTATDQAGHLHVFGVAGNPFPTLTRVNDGWAEPCETCSDCGDIEYYYLACELCGEKLWPSPSGPGVQRPDHVAEDTYRYWIGDERVTQRDARLFTDGIREEDRDRWDRLHGWLKYSAGLLLPAKRSRGSSAA